MTASLRWSQQSGGNQGLQLPRAWQSFRPGEKPPHSGQGWVPPTVWEEAAPFRAGLGAPAAWVWPPTAWVWPPAAGSQRRSPYWSSWLLEKLRDTGRNLLIPEKH